MMRRLLRLVALLAVLAAAPALAQTDTSHVTDSLASGGSLSGSRLRRLPVDDARHAFALIPGVVLRSGDIGIATQPTFSIRGATPGQASTYVDGAPVRFQVFGTSGIAPAPNAIANVSVTTGVAPVLVADASGGVVDYVTRTGSDHLTGDLRWDSDEPFGDGVTVGYNRIEGSLGGPLPVTANLSFFVSATLQGQRSSYRGPGAASVPTYLPAGIDTTVDAGGGSFVAIPRIVQWSGACDATANAGFECQGLRRPLDWSTVRRAQAKVAYRYGASSVLSVTGIGGDLQQRFFPGQLALNPAMYGGRQSSSAAAIVNWRHDLGPWHGGPLAFQLNVSIVGHRRATGPLDGATEATTRDPYLGIALGTLRFAGADVLNLPASNELIRDLRTASGTRGVPFFGMVPDPFQGGRTNPYGLAVNGWWTGGLGGRLTYANERRLQGRWVLEWRPGVHHVAIGADVERSDVSYYSSDIVRQLGTDLFAADPRRLGVFVGDRLAFGDAVIDIGLRYDRLDPGGDVPNVPAFISASGPALWNANAATDDTAYANSVARVFHAARGRGVVSPRLRFTHPLGTRTTLRLDYSRTVQPPTWQTIFGHSNSDISFTNVFDFFGRDVTFGVSSLIDVGARSLLGPRATLDVAIYRKTLPQYVGRLQAFADPRDPTRFVTINVATAFDGAQVQGVDASVAWTSGRWLSASAAYAFARTVADPALTESDVTTHALAVSAVMRVPDEWKAVGGTEAVVFVRALSGAPYTRLVNNGIGAIAPDESGFAFAEPRNASRLPWTKQIDLRITKAVRVGGRDWSLYADLRNLLDFHNTVAVFAETGTTTNDLHRALTIGDPAGSGEYAILWSEASNVGALQPDGTTVNLSACGSWGSPVNCVALTRVERRFGNGDGFFSLVEQERAFNAYYDDFFGAWRFFGAGRTLRIGVQLEL